MLIEGGEVNPLSCLEFGVNALRRCSRYFGLMHNGATLTAILSIEFMFGAAIKVLLCVHVLEMHNRFSLPMLIAGGITVNYPIVPCVPVTALPEAAYFLIA